MAGACMHRGFPLGRVPWGYREQFRAILDSLHRKGILTDDPEQCAALFKPLVRPDMPVGSEYVLKEFLAALDGKAGWLVRSPELLREWRRLGVLFAAEKTYLGRRYFQLWAEGRLPESPVEVARILRWVAELAQTDAELALSFLLGYPDIQRHVALGQLAEFIENGREVYRRNRQTGHAYFGMKLRSAEAFAQRLSRTCRLEDVRGRLERLFRAVAGRGVRVDSLSRLDSDDLLDRRCGVVCGGGSLFLPERVSISTVSAVNRAYYLTATLLAAACHRFAGFCGVHGRKDGRRISEVLGRRGVRSPAVGGFLFQVGEAYRLRRTLWSRCPGTEKLMCLVGRQEAEARGQESTGDELLVLAVGALATESARPEARRVFQSVARLAGRCEDYECVLDGLCRNWESLASDVRAAGGGLPVPPLGFMPDHDFPLELTPAPTGSLVVRAEERAGGRATARPSALAEARPREGARTTEDTGDRNGAGSGDDEEPVPAYGAVPQVFLYDEWNGLAGEYYRDWCRLREVRPDPRGPAGIESDEFRRMVDHVKKLFQRLKPELVTKEKYLRSGDYIDIDGLVRFVTMKKANASPRDHFWVKPRLSRRDIAVALLLDVSGSTGERAGRKDVITMEKQAAAVLAAGLHELGDRFGVFGFTGNGRENCQFSVFKSFEEDWDAQAAGRLMSVRPGSSTRMGVALRHVGAKLSVLSAKTRLVVLITDGKPMDSDYDPNTRYAHHDVRKACEENRRLGIHPFCVALEPDDVDALDVMFPRGRYLVLRDVEQLPELLSRAYLRLTRA